MRSPQPRISVRIKLPIIKYGKELRRASIARPGKKLPTCRRYPAAHDVRTSEFRLHPVQHSGLWDRGCREERGVTAWGRRVFGCDTRCRCVFRHRIVETRSCTRWRDRVRSRTGPRTDGMKMANVAQHRLVDRDWQRLRSGPRYAAAWRESADAPTLWCPRRFP